MTDNNFAKKFRLLSVQDFSQLKVDSKLFKKFNLRVFYKLNTLENSRLGISVPKSVGGAVIRNRLKRKIRESFRSSTFKFSNYDFLVVVLVNKNNADLVKIEKNVLLSLNEFFQITK